MAGPDVQPPVFETLDLSVDGDTATATLNRPERANAVDLQVLRELVALADWLRGREDLRFLVITNEGNVFAAGQNLKELHSLLEPEADRRFRARTLQLLAQEMMTKLESLEQITFCGLRGSAYGAGVAIALTTDFRVMADDAVLNLPEVRLGMFLTYGSLPRLVAAVGATRAKELVMFARDLTAQEALAGGIVVDAVPRADVLPTVGRLIAELRPADQRALRITKKVANAAAAVHTGDVLLAEPDLVEGAMADGSVLSRLEDFLRTRTLPS